jgi:hypothetical protein
MFTFTDHSRRRSAQRNLSVVDIEYVLTYGQYFCRAGAEFYYLRRRDIREWELDRDLSRLAGTAIILGKDGQTLITTWRNRRSGLKNIRRKRQGTAKTSTEGSF